MCDVASIPRQQQQQHPCNQLSLFQTMYTMMGLGTVPSLTLTPTTCYSTLAWSHQALKASDLFLIFIYLAALVLVVACEQLVAECGI